MGYWSVAGNVCSARCPSTDVAHVVCTTERSMITVPMDFGSNTSSHDTWSNDSLEIGQEVIHMEIVWSDMGVMCGQIMCSEVVCKIFLMLVPINSELCSCNLICIKKLHISMDFERCFLTLQM